MLTFGLEEERKRKITNGDLDGPQPKMKKGEEGYEEEKHGEEEDAAAANDGEEATVEATEEATVEKANEEKEERRTEEEEERGEDNRLEHEYANDPAEVMLIECKTERNSSPELDDSTSQLSQLSQLSGNSMEIDMNGKILNSI